MTVVADFDRSEFPEMVHQETGATRARSEVCNSKSWDFVGWVYRVESQPDMREAWKWEIRSKASASVKSTGE